MRDTRGRFVKGYNNRLYKPHWDKDWLYTEYIIHQRTALDIAKQEGCRENAIRYWLYKFGIPRRKAWDYKRYGLRGSANPHWKGGISSERQKFIDLPEWKDIIREIYARDKKRCQRCGKRKIKHSNIFHIHHCISFSDKDLRTNIDNLILFCRKCHLWVHSKQNKERKFIGTFQTKLRQGI